jgi:hypothetical protein
MNISRSFSFFFFLLRDLFLNKEQQRKTQQPEYLLQPFLRRKNKILIDWIYPSACVKRIQSPSPRQ